MNEEMEIVLIEDDEDDARRMLKFLRENFTNKVRHIQDGEDAVRFILFPCDNCPKLILLDLVLPNIDGIELFQMIRREPAKRQLSVMFMISSLESKTYIESLGLNPDGYLKKPTATKPPARFENNLAYTQTPKSNYYQQTLGANVSGMSMGTLLRP